MSAVTASSLRNDPILLKEVCSGLGLSTRSLAKALLCEPKTVRSWQGGEHKPDPIRAVILLALHRSKERLGVQKFTERIRVYLTDHNTEMVGKLLELSLMTEAGVPQEQVARVYKDHPGGSWTRTRAKPPGLLARLLIPGAAYGLSSPDDENNVDVFNFCQAAEELASGASPEGLDFVAEKLIRSISGA